MCICSLKRSPSGNVVWRVLPLVEIKGYGWNVIVNEVMYFWGGFLWLLQGFVVPTGFSGPLANFKRQFNTWPVVILWNVRLVSLPFPLLQIGKDYSAEMGEFSHKCPCVSGLRVWLSTRAVYSGRGNGLAVLGGKQALLMIFKSFLQCYFCTFVHIALT